MNHKRNVIGGCGQQNIVLCIGIVCYQIVGSGRNGFIAGFKYALSGIFFGNAYFEIFRKQNFVAAAVL